MAFSHPPYEGVFSPHNPVSEVPPPLHSKLSDWQRKGLMYWPQCFSIDAKCRRRVRWSREPDGTILRESDDHSTLEVYEMNSSASDRKSPRILIADDDPYVLGVVADRCARMGFDIETASNGLQVLAKAGQCKPDVLLLDVHMPEVDGLSALGYLREISKNSIHVMIVTGNPGREIMRACEEYDVSCICKGRGFWIELETCLVMLYPQREAEIRRSRKGSAQVEVRKRPRVLLVDDDIGVKNFFFHHFQKLGAEVIYASDGVTGYWKARRLQPTVIVADYCMPNGGAEYLLSRLRDTPETRNIPVIVQSGRRLS